MGAVLKSIKTLKKSKTFPGPKAEEQLRKRFKQRQKKGERVTGETVATDPTLQRIHRTKSRRDTKALQIKDFRKNKGKFTAYTSNQNLAGAVGKGLPKHYLKYGNVRQEGPMAVVTKAGTPKKDLRKFKEFIKTGTRRK